MIKFGDVSGVNNQFLVETTHEVAVKYNDRSPLENMHCATLGCLMGPGLVDNWKNGVPESRWLM